MDRMQVAPEELERERETQALLQLLNKRVVTIGGGTGPFAVLSSLKRYPCSITAIVTMSDSGGSSRRLMDEFGQLPLGDLRQALIALSRKGTLWRDVFNYRFQKNNGRRPVANPADSHAQQLAEQAGVSGHSLGNLIISALQELNEGSLLRAIEDVQELLDAAGKVFPVTLSHTTLCAEMESGETICGETEIDTRGIKHLGALSPIKRVYLQETTLPCEDAIWAIRRADVIVIGPGDLFTSIIPNLLVEGIAEAVRSSEARKIYVCNLMTKHGETDDFTASDFVREIHRYLGGWVDRVIVHDGSFPDHLLAPYTAQAQHPVKLDEERIRQLVPDVIVDKLLAIHQGHFVRHDADRLVRAIFTPPSLHAVIAARSEAWASSLASPWRKSS